MAIERKRRMGGGLYFSRPNTAKAFIKSGSTTLDLALGSGWVEGRFINIIGDSSSGKTLLCIEAGANFAKKYPKKGIIRYRENEAAFDEPYAKEIGFPLDRVDFGKGLDTVEDLFNDLNRCAQHAIKSKEPQLYICDSLDALSDEAELNTDFGKASFGASKAKDMSKLFRKLPLHAMEESLLTVIFVSQIRDRIGVKFGRKWTRSGGRALTFYCSQIVVLANTGKISKKFKSREVVTGIKIRARVEKNKVSVAFKEADFPITFGFGIDDVVSCLDYLDTFGGGGKDALSGLSEEKFLSAIDNHTGDWRKWQEHLQETVRNRWYKIQEDNLPKFRKYE